MPLGFVEGGTMQMAGEQQPSPRGGGAAAGAAGGGGGGMAPKLSLVGVGHYASPTPGFSILGSLEPHQPPVQPTQHHHLAPPLPPPQPHFHPAPFPNLLQQGFLLTAAQQGYNLQLATPPQVLQVMEELIKLSPPGSPPIDVRGASAIHHQHPQQPYVVSLLEQKTDQLQALVHSLSQAIQHNGGGVQAMAVAHIASNISQLALAAIGVLPSAQPSSCLLPELAAPLTLNTVAVPTPTTAVRNPLPQPPPPPQPQPQESPHAFGLEVPALAAKNTMAEREHERDAVAPPSTTTPTPPAPPAPPAPPTAMEGGGDSGAGSRDDDDDGEAEELVPGSYDLVEMNAVEILAEHTHFCDKCGKGFKRDANLRMHMRGHGEQYKSPSALARPDKMATDPSLVRPRRYSCPYAGCKRNKKHRKFQPLKTVLCVKNHYRRSHCPKSLTCSKCKSKKFSVVADLKTHEKHCGRDKWLCSCGTTFSRKDKLLGHISLFQGHTPALPLHDIAEASSASAVTSAGSVGGEEQQH